MGSRSMFSSLRFWTWPPALWHGAARILARGFCEASPGFAFMSWDAQCRPVRWSRRDHIRLLLSSATFFSYSHRMCLARQRREYPEGRPHRVQSSVDAAETPSTGLVPQSHLASFTSFHGAVSYECFFAFSLLYRHPVERLRPKHQDGYTSMYTTPYEDIPPCPAQG